MGLGTESLLEAGEGREVVGATYITTRQLILQAQGIKKVLEEREAFGGGLYLRLLMS